MTNELKPCPFCGGEAEFERVGTERYSTIVVCTECGARHESGDVREVAGISWNNRPYENKLLADAVREYKDSLIKKASDIPIGLECRSKGANCYNWAMYYAREATDYADKIERGEV